MVSLWWAEVHTRLRREHRRAVNPTGELILALRTLLARTTDNTAFLQDASSTHKKDIPSGMSFLWWAEVDSNHRSRRRQIYSLIHLATLESALIYEIFVEPVIGLEPTTC